MTKRDVIYSFTCAPDSVSDCVASVKHSDKLDLHRRSAIWFSVYIAIEGEDVVLATRQRAVNTDALWTADDTRRDVVVGNGDGLTETNSDISANHSFTDTKRNPT